MEASASTSKSAATTSKAMKNGPRNASTNAPRNAPVATASHKPSVGQNKQKGFVYENMAVEVRVFCKTRHYCYVR